MKYRKQIHEVKTKQFFIIVTTVNKNTDFLKTTNNKRPHNLFIKAKEL